MDSPKISRTTAATLVRRGDDFLFLRQNKTDGAYAGTLHFPGGNLEPGESPEDGARREILEETGLRVKNLRPAAFDSDAVFYKGEPTRLIFLQFTADAEPGEARAGSDASEIVWVPRAGLAAAALNPATIKFLQKIDLLPR